MEEEPPSEAAQEIYEEVVEMITERLYNFELLYGTVEMLKQKKEIAKFLSELFEELSSE